MRVKSINCTGFLGKKRVHMNSASELKFIRTGFSKEKKRKTVHFSEQCDSHAPLFSGSSPREAAK